MFYYTDDGQVAYFPSAWTDAGQADPFVALSAGRAVSRFVALLRLVKLIEDLKASTIRAVQVEGRAIAQAALDSGLSRPTIYEARENFRQEGIEGLLPEKRGPKNPRKLTPQIRGYLEELVASNPDLKAAALVQRVRRRFGMLLHVRTVEKALRKKGRRTL